MLVRLYACMWMHLMALFKLRWKFAKHPFQLTTTDFPIYLRNRSALLTWSLRRKTGAGYIRWKVRGFSESSIQFKDTTGNYLIINIGSLWLCCWSNKKALSDTNNKVECHLTSGHREEWAVRSHVKPGCFSQIDRFNVWDIMLFVKVIVN